MKTHTQKLVTTGALLAVGLVLPMFFHMFGAGGVMLPLHIPVLLCGLVCGAPYGAACGLILPFLSSVLTGMPPLFPTAIAMSLELCTYGIVTGVLYRTYANNIYLSLVVGMLAGRVVSGVAHAVLLGFSGGEYSLQIFLTAAFITGLPGIIIQLLFIPVLVMLLTKARLLDKPKRRVREG
ncbi:ECF transporter S component [Ruminococcaceae bacterium OttesenSCG-928-I18]|nr:ECF transporter S component [Ruminococcaceae bacterium OttesenSCG-928-I18]